MAVLERSSKHGIRAQKHCSSVAWTGVGHRPIGRSSVTLGGTRKGRGSSASGRLKTRRSSEVAHSSAACQAVAGGGREVKVRLGSLYFGWWWLCG
ncbi:hypothetical protein M6B38_315060 [Iris pallida]|uniref:Uncharacterized protein n=1 Tax=Iris pallida TaxID=29817 RepID=A0AAX6HEN0_IRIPA|nr:hypothetical protein M6B38_315060 [Iris pallida]